MTETSGGAAPVAGEPGWFSDPWGTEKLRWWDGQAWTPHLYPPADSSPAGLQPQAGGTSGGGAGGGWHSGTGQTTGWSTGNAQASPGPVLATAVVGAEHVSGHWARIGLLWAGPLQALYAVGVAIQARWYADHFHEIAKGHSPKLTGAAASVGPVLSYCSLGVLVAGVLFVVWIYRAAVVARVLGLPARRSPALVACSFLIPVVNLWWPYQSMCDLLPPGHPGRRVVGRWWATWITSSLLVPLLFLTGYGPAWVRGLVAGVAVVVTLFAAAGARLVIATVADAHEMLAGASR